MTTPATSASTSFSTSLTLRFASPSLDNINALNITILHKFRRKLLRNYTSWCSYLGKKSNIWGLQEVSVQAIALLTIFYASFRGRKEDISHIIQEFYCTKMNELNSFIWMPFANSAFKLGSKEAQVHMWVWVWMWVWDSEFF
ncbi:hypothetical protein ACJW31_04G060800 [Castanea mollissima]